MLIDMHAHLWGGSYAQDKNTILRAMDTYNITKVYVSGLSVHCPNEAEVTEANAEVAKFIQEQDGRIGGYVYVSPEHPNAQDVVRRGIEEQGMDGVKLWISTFCDVPEVNPIAELAIDYGVPMLVHAFYKATGQYPNESIGKNVAVLARRYPELKIIMAHLGGNCYDGIPAIRDCPNVWVDYSGSVFRADELDYALEHVGEDRIVHGSDMPGAYLMSYGQVLGLHVSDAVREKILWRNAVKLFDRNFRLGDQNEEDGLQLLCGKLAVL